MPLINLSLKHGQSLDTAQSQLEKAVRDIQSQFQGLVRQVQWSDDHDWVRLNGTGFWVEMQVDAQDVHVSGDILLLGQLFGGPLTAGLKRIVQQTFQLKSG
jgi:hypothetical protein